MMKKIKSSDICKICEGEEEGAQAQILKMIFSYGLWASFDWI